MWSRRETLNPETETTKEEHQEDLITDLHPEEVLFTTMCATIAEGGVTGREEMMGRANECREGDWSNRCYRCGGRGHLRRDCKAR